MTHPTSTPPAAVPAATIAAGPARAAGRWNIGASLEGPMREAAA
jgi:hypothetical protein